MERGKIQIISSYKGVFAQRFCVSRLENRGIPLLLRKKTEMHLNFKIAPRKDSPSSHILISLIGNQLAECRSVFAMGDAKTFGFLRITRRITLHFILGV